MHQSTKNENANILQSIKNNDTGDDNILCKVNCYIPLSKIKSRDFYQHFNSSNYTDPTCNVNLRQKFNLSNEECKKVFELPFKVTLDSKLRWLQYRIIHGILVTNKWLFKVGISVSDKCVYCDEVETIDHIFTSCHVVKKFWDSICAHLSFMPDLNDFGKIYGVLEPSDNQALFNQILIIIRQCIYNSKHKGVVPNLSLLKNMIKNTVRIEENIAKKIDKLHIHVKKWSNIKDYNIH